MKITVTPPQFHAGFSPILLKCEGAVGDKLAITISSDGVDDFNISSTLIKKEQTVNLAAYVQSLFGKADTQAVSYTLKVNGEPCGGAFYALRSAAQLGCKADLSAKLGGFLTDMSRIDVWEGYPARQVSILAEEGYNVQVASGGELHNTLMDEGFSNIEASCGDSELIVYTNAAIWLGYHCQLTRVTYPFTVHVGDRTAKLSGTVSLTLKKIDGNTYVKAAPYSGFQDIHFEIPVEETIVAISITANGALDTNSVQIVSALQPYRERQLPTATCTLPATHSILTADSGLAIGENSSRLLSLTLNQPIV